MRYLLITSLFLFINTTVYSGCYPYDYYGAHGGTATQVEVCEPCGPSGYYHCYNQLYQSTYVCPETHRCNLNGQVYENPGCSNGSKDEGETGTDCGGSCDDTPCVQSCNAGDTAWFSPETGDPFCRHSVPKDANGNCPSGYEPTTNAQTGESYCTTDYPPFLGKGGTNGSGDPPSPPSDLPGDSLPGDGTGGGTSTEDPVDPLDPTGPTVSNTTYNYNSPNVTITQTTETVTDPETGDENTEFSGDVTYTPPVRYAPDINADIPNDELSRSRLTTRYNSFKLSLQNAPVYVPLRSVLSPSVGAGVSEYSISCGSYGSYTMNLADYASVWAVFRMALLFVSMFVAARLILANK